MNLTIDYLNDETGRFERRVIDDMEFCIREGIAYFESGGKRYAIPLENVSQLYPTRS